MRWLTDLSMIKRHDRWEHLAEQWNIKWNTLENVKRLSLENDQPFKWNYVEHLSKIELIDSYWFWYWAGNQHEIMVCHANLRTLDVSPCKSGRCTHMSCHSPLSVHPWLSVWQLQSAASHNPRNAGNMVLDSVDFCCRLLPDAPRNVEFL